MENVNGQSYGFTGYIQGSLQVECVDFAKDAVPNENINVTQASNAIINFFIVPTSLNNIYSTWINKFPA